MKAARVKLRMIHKGLILVSIPLVLELLFVNILEARIRESVHNWKRADRCNNIAYLARALLDDLTAARSTESHSFARRSGEALAGQGDRLLGEATEHCQQIELLLHKDSEHTGAQEQTVQLAKQYITASKQEKTATAGNLSLSAQGGIAGSDPADESSWSSLLRQLGSLSTDEHDRANAYSSLAKLSEQSVQQCILFGLIAGIIVTPALVLYFSQMIVRRIAVIVSNADRFSRNKELLPPIAGDDELTQLDRTFRTMAQDIQEARSVEQRMLDAVTNSERRLSELMENIAIGIVALNSVAEIEFANRSAQRFFGYSSTELRGANINCIFPDLDRATFLKAMTESVPEAGRKVTAKTKGGVCFPAEVILSEFEMRDGTRYLLSVQDISVREAAEQVKRDFVNMISHDLRTPLNSVQATLTIMAEGIYGQLSDKGVIKARQAEESVDRLIRMVNDLLEIERLGSGKLPMDLQPTPIANIIRRSLDVVCAPAQEAGISIDTNVSDCTVMVDEGRMIQVLVNLLSNAIKFSPRESRISVTAAPDNKDEVEVQVHDSGRGVPPELRNAIFERFYQVENSDSRRSHGAGLGLAICKAIVEGHGGRIGMDSHSGQGSTFWFTLPIISETLSPPASTIHASATEYGARTEQELSSTISLEGIRSLGCIVPPQTGENSDNG